MVTWFVYVSLAYLFIEAIGGALAFKVGKTVTLRVLGLCGLAGSLLSGITFLVPAFLYPEVDCSLVVGLVSLGIQVVTIAVFFILIRYMKKKNIFDKLNK